MKDDQLQQQQQQQQQQQRQQQQQQEAATAAANSGNQPALKAAELALECPVCCLVTSCDQKNDLAHIIQSLLRLSPAGFESLGVFRLSS